MSGRTAPAATVRITVARSPSSLLEENAIHALPHEAAGLVSLTHAVTTSTRPS
jgi:hypothetical protein